MFNTDSDTLEVCIILYITIEVLLIFSIKILKKTNQQNDLEKEVREEYISVFADVVRKIQQLKTNALNAKCYFIDRMMSIVYWSKIIPFTIHHVFWSSFLVSIITAVIVAIAYFTLGYKINKN